MPTPEELARQNIDALLQQCGWLIQDYKKLDLSAGRGIAIREVRLKKGAGQHFTPRPLIARDGGRDRSATRPDHLRPGLRHGRFPARGA
jgi:hypothetical protein